MPLALFGMRCLYPISSIGETVPWPVKTPIASLRSIVIYTYTLISTVYHSP